MVQENFIKNKIIIICGPTGTGKSRLAALIADKLGSEVISADSVAVYKDLNIGAAKPTEEEKRGVTHHLIDVVSPFESFTVSDYERLSLPIIDRLLLEGRTPVICGGTGYYINAILYKMSYGNAPENKEIREKYAKLIEENGCGYVYDILKEADPETAETTHPNDIMRVVRALEIYEVSGRKKSDFKDKKIPRYDYTAVSYDFPREILYNRINSRVDKMFESGLVEEVKGLIAKGITEENQCMQGIGYKEVYEAVKNGTLSEVAEVIKMNSRRYAKRQITFFKKLPELKYIPSGGDTETDAEKVLQIFNL